MAHAGDEARLGLACGLRLQCAATQILFHLFEGIDVDEGSCCNTCLSAILINQTAPAKQPERRSIRPQQAQFQIESRRMPLAKCIQCLVQGRDILSVDVTMEGRSRQL